MKTNFFAAMAPLLSGMNLTFTVAKDDSGTIIVSVLPQLRIKDDAKESIQPMVIRGTIEELDNEFLSAIKEPMAKVSGIVIEIENFEKGAKILEEENKAKDAIKAEAKKNKEKAEKIIKKAQELFDAKDYDSAEKELDKAIKLTPGTPAVNKLSNSIKDAKTSNNQVDIFASIEEVKEEPKVEKTAPIAHVESDAEYAERVPKIDDLPESPNELEKENNRVIHSVPMNEDEIQVLQEEMDGKFNVSQESNTFKF